MERTKIIKNIGPLDGRVLAFGGIYSNYQSLRQLKSISEEWGIEPESIICTGDLVAYCAKPEECIELVKSWGIHVIAGNVEIQLREGKEDCGCDFAEGGRCDTLSRQWYPFVQEKLSEASIQWMQELPDFIRFEYENLQGLAVHGSYFETAEYIYKSTSWERKAKNLKEAEADLILAGHCGLPFSDKNEGKYWINPGVIGMPPNDGSPRVWYAILEGMESGKLNYSHRSFAYDHEKAALSMELNYLPAEYSKTLRTGLWDNTEILPEAETELTGLPISF